MNLFTHAEARKQRDEVLTRVAENAGDFMQVALNEIKRLTGEHTGESIRLHCEGMGIYPHHNNAWGSVISTAIKHRLLLPTGRWTPMSGPKSHARQTQIYRMGREQ